MFEKEAEERITEQFGTSGEYVTRQRIWQDGAEFGYNKANEEMQVQLAISEHDREHNDYELAEAYKKIESLEAQIEKMKGCHNCRHFTKPYKLCCYSLGDEDYDCRGRKWEIQENE